ncbi:gamma-glutamyl-gamma-aminobutyrate hydrolase family protein [Arthrobacter sp. UM1]|uniref:gamma-glutamyl-gamma-aminobutyrate hydrolase family protein n=1 Tax=Arthrobacter sp. UM1 TaxID=2766776 RepID=UPI001CF6D19E|nr:gamma-glutamyl-gamma-aminobutyrate hydrolase family protein [Arthrobacter sp. UM1]
MSGSETRPVIGITTYLQQGSWGVWNGMAAIVPLQYATAIVDSGGTPVLFPPLGDDYRVLDGVDGLMLIGGGDVDPGRYGAEPHEKTVSDQARDAYEFGLLAAAEEAGLPTLCVCRGAQVLNVARGGTLHQHLPDVLEHADRYRPAPAVFGDTPVTTDPGSAARGILGERAVVSSYHHQGIDRVGRGLSVTARSEDGLPQFLEAEGPQWLVATQYHPEERPDEAGVFEELVRQSAEFARRGRRLPETTARPTTKG